MQVKNSKPCHRCTHIYRASSDRSEAPGAVKQKTQRQSGALRRSTHTANGHLALQFSEGQNQIIALFLNAQGFHVAE